MNAEPLCFGAVFILLFLPQDLVQPVALYQHRFGIYCSTVLLKKGKEQLLQQGLLDVLS